MKQSEIRYRLLDLLANSSGYHTALMTTFNFEISFFERAILNRLYENNLKKVSIFVDSKELAKSLQEIDISSIGRKYMVNPVQMMGSFHPKIILLLGENKARLIVGSGNVTTSGYAINNEVFNFIDYSADQPAFLDIIVGAINFFHEINDISFQLDNDILQETKKLIYYHKSEVNKKIYLLQNMTKSILSQVKEKIEGEVEEIKIAVPYYDNELAALCELNTIFPLADVDLYVQNEKSTFPIEYNRKHKIINRINVFTGFNDNSLNGCNNFYHGKIIQFKTDDKTYILYGSSNCTQSALVKSFDRGGNIECDFFQVGELQEFDYFFENLNLQEDIELVSNIMVFEEQEFSNYIFKYGLAKGGLELHLSSSSRKSDLRVFINDMQLKYDDISDKVLIVHVPEELRPTLSDIFTLTLSYEGKIETLRCWTFCVADLESNRENLSEKKLIDDFDIDSDGDKYIEDRIKLLQAELTCLPELLEYKKKLAYFNQIKREQEGDEGEPEDFIVDVQIPDEYRMAYKQYTQVSRIRDMFLMRSFPEYREFLRLNDRSTANEYHGDQVKQDGITTPRKATSAEKSFERFVKSKVQGMMNDLYVDIIEPDHYLGLIMVVLHIFNKYNNIYKVEGIFDASYIIKTRTDFFVKLLGKEFKGSNIENYKESFLSQCFRILWENHNITMKETDYCVRAIYDLMNRNLLMAMEKKYGIRGSYEKYLDALMNKRINSPSNSEMKAIIDYIENLYGYKNFDQLQKIIKSVYDNAVIVLNADSLLIKTTTNEIQKHFKPDAIVIGEIRKFSRNVSHINSVSIIIDNGKPDPKNKKEIVQRKHSVSFEFQNWKTSFTRKDGSVYDPKKSEFLNF